MIAELGQILLCLALIAACAQIGFTFRAAQLESAQLESLPFWNAGRFATLLHAGFLLLAFGCLIALHVSGDFSVKTVVSNSHSLMPMLYKVTGAWGNHEGSLLLWTLALAIFGMGMLLTTQSAPLKLRQTAIAMQGIIGLGFVLFLVLTSNPFMRISPPALEGQDLNPLLQDPGLAFHPPLLYLGYVGLSVSFSFAVAALIWGHVTREWAAWVRPWTLLAWVFLTAGIGLGSWWAYYELGWGGFWFWDPVENASLAPWLVATALLHSMSAMQKRNTLKTWTILLAILSFSLSLLGTFIVRSGLLNSVHSFTNDPGRGLFILILLALIVGFALTLYAMRASQIEQDATFDFISRESALSFNNLILVVAAITVIFGILYPLALELIVGRIVTVGAGYFNLTVTPMFLLLLVALGIGPILAWKNGQGHRAMRRLRSAFGVTIAGTCLIAYVLSPEKLAAICGFGAALWLTASIVSEAIRRGRAGLTASFGAMSLAHLGLAVFAVGAVGASLLGSDAVGLLNPRDQARNSISLAGYTAVLENVQIVDGANYQALRGELRVTSEDGETRTAAPERRRYIASGQETTEAAILSDAFGDLHFVIDRPLETEAQTASDGYVIRMFYKPFAAWLWVGVLLLCAGGGLAIWSMRRMGSGESLQDQ